MADGARPVPLRAELMAAAVVAAHNHVLCRWLRGESSYPVREVNGALSLVASQFSVTTAGMADVGTTVVAFRTG
jgi:hypothetical protein